MVYCIGSPKSLQSSCKGSVDPYAHQVLSLSAFFRFLQKMQCE